MEGHAETCRKVLRACWTKRTSIKAGGDNVQDDHQFPPDDCKNAGELALVCAQIVF